MRPADRLAGFVRDALVAGRSREDIRTALSHAGWSPAEVDTALTAWAETPFDPPVPRPQPYVSAAEAFLYSLMFFALAMTAWNLTSLLFELIDGWLPDPVDGLSGISASRVRWAISILVVFFPLFLLLNARATRAAARDPGTRRSSVRKWFAYVTLFLAALGLIGDLVAVIYAFLSGDLTTRFAAKAATVAVVAGAVLAYFRGELADRTDAR
jgi:hypothetical protein